MLEKTVDSYVKIVNGRISILYNRNMRKYIIFFVFGHCLNANIMKFMIRLSHKILWTNQFFILLLKKMFFVMALKIAK